MLNRARLILEKIENYPVKLWQLLFWAGFILSFRFLLESQTDNRGRIIEFSAIVSWSAFYLLTFFTIILIYHLFCRQDINKIAKVVLFFCFFIWLAPIIDWLFPFYSNMSYVIVDSWDLVFKSYVSLALGGFYKTGASLGIKVELVFALFGSFGYLILQRAKWYKAVLGSLVVYFFIITLFLLPTLQKFIYRAFGVDYHYSTTLMGFSIVVPSLLVILLLFYFGAKEKLLIWLKSINWFRISIVWALMLIGLSLYYYQRFDPLDWANNFLLYIFKAIALAVVGFLIWQSIRLFNDLADYQADLESNNNNLLKSLSRADLINIAIIYLFSLIYLALLFSYDFLIIASVYLLIGYFYSFKPVHFKRHFVLSSLALGFNYLLAFWLGYVAFFKAGDSLNLIPLKYNLLVFLIFSLAISFKDIKDSQSDAASGVKTILTEFSPKVAAKIISALIFICIALPAVFINPYLILPGVLAFAALYYITEKFADISKETIIILIIIAYLISAGVILKVTSQNYQVGQINLAKDSGWHPTARQEVWFLSSLLVDSEKNQYYFSQTYDPGIGSILTLVSLDGKKKYKEFFPQSEGLAITKNQFNFNQLVSGYFDSQQVFSQSIFSYQLLANFFDGYLRLSLDQKDKSEILTLTTSGRVPLPNNQAIYYYALPDLKTTGQILFKNEKVSLVSGQSWLEHYWSDSKINYQGWSGLDLVLTDGTKMTVFVFDYGQDKAILYGTKFKNGISQRFTQAKIKAINFWESPVTKNRYLSELELNNQELNFSLKLKAGQPDQEIIGQAAWEGPLSVSGEIDGQKVSGWASFREASY